MELTGMKPAEIALHRRRVKLSGTKNFRDLGGYRTTDGTSVRWGVLHRSDSLHRLTQSDLKTLTSFGIRLVIDFRAEHEVEKRPDRLPEAARLVNLPMEDASTKVWHEARDEMVKNMKTLDPAHYMMRTNVELATTFTPGYRQFFQELLLSNGSPAVFHCAAGKDRTGFAAAVLLRMLGVPMQTVAHDYLLTNQYLLNAYAWNLWLAGILRGRKFVEGIRGFMRADERYLRAAFDALEKSHGSFENYLRDGLSLSAHDVERLKRYYLEQAFS